MGPCKPHWTAIPQDLIIKILEPFEFTAFTDPTFDWYHVLKRFWVSMFGFAWIQTIWWTTFKWLLAPLCYLYLECGIERYLARVRLHNFHPLHYHDVRIWYPTTLELQVPGILRLSTTPWIEQHRYYSRSKKSHSPFGHVHYGLRLRVCATATSLFSSDSTSSYLGR